MCNTCTHLTTKHMQTSPSLALLAPSLGLYCFPESCAARSGQASCHQGVRPSGTAVYLCCLLRATASLRLSTECNCFSTGTTAARQVCSKHPLIKSLFAESLVDVLVNRCIATTALLQLLSDTAAAAAQAPSSQNMSAQLFHKTIGWMGGRPAPPSQPSSAARARALQRGSLTDRYACLCRAHYHVKFDAPCTGIVRFHAPHTMGTAVEAAAANCTSL